MKYKSKCYNTFFKLESLDRAMGKARNSRIFRYLYHSRKARFCLAALIVFVALAYMTSLDDLRYESESLVSFDRNNELLSLFVNEEENFKVSIDTQIEEIPNELQEFIVLYEDKRFFSHLGVDIRAIARALKANLTSQKRQGASTISMQAIKLGARNKNRTLFVKAKESLQALRLELYTPKPKILRLYVDNAPYGYNIVGIKTASLLYFTKPLSQLSPAQNAFLAVLPNAPSLIRINPNKLKSKRDALLLKAKEQGIIDELSYELAILEPLPNLERTNSIAPHYTMFLASIFPNQKVFYTNIDKTIQLRLESLAKNYALTLADKKIQNLAFILLDAKERTIRAYVGSQDFYDIEGFGQIDGIQAKRNVGSTLKPFLYALSLDDGLIIPQTKLIDSNRFYGNFNPQNANRMFSERKEALFALRNSLNVPFVNLLQDYGVERFFYFLRQNLGFSDMDYQKYGLSLILGTKELSLFDVSKLYLGLRRGGEFEPILLTQEQFAQSKLDSSQNPQSPNQAQNPNSPQNNPAQILAHIDSSYVDSSVHTPISKEAAYMTIQGLLDIYMDLQSGLIAPKIAWKSGTSFGNYDSWAMGISDSYVLGVWGGNFDAKASVSLVGREIAGKLMFHIFENLEHFQKQAEFKDFSQIGNWSNTPKMREVRVDSNGYRTLGEPFSIAFMPYYAKPLRVAKDMFVSNDSFRIIYPTNDILIQLHSDNTLVAKIENKVNKDSQTYYFLNGAFIAQSKQKSITLNPQKGKNILYAITQDGESDQVEFNIIK